MLVGECGRGKVLPATEYRKQGERDTERGQKQDMLTGAPLPLPQATYFLPLGKFHFSKLPEIPEDHY